MHAQRFRHPQEVAHLHLLAGLHALQRVARHVGGFPETLLGPAQVYASEADAVTDPAAGLNDPLRVFGGHAFNVAAKMILCQPQFWGN